MVSLSLGSIYKMAFGYQTEAFDPNIPALPYKRTVDEPYGHMTSKRGSAYSAKNPNTGREYYMPVTLKWIDAAGKQQVLSLHHPIVRIGGAITTVDTRLSERDGTVKHLISSDDTYVTVRGIIISKDGTYPEDENIELRNMITAKKAMDIECPITDIFLETPNDGFAQVFLRRWDINEFTRSMGASAYELGFVSDVTFNLEEI